MKKSTNVLSKIVPSSTSLSGTLVKDTLRRALWTEWEDHQKSSNIQCKSVWEYGNTIIEGITSLYLSREYVFDEPTDGQSLFCL